MQYSFSCPISGCGEKMTVEADNDEQALGKLIAYAKGHLTTKHQGVEKTEEEIRADIAPKMVKEE